MRRFVPISDISSAAKLQFRGRDARYLAPPAQIRTCGFPAYGSHLGYRRQFGAVDEPTSCATLTRLGAPAFLFAVFLFAVSVAVGLTPEMLPMIVSANLAKGALAPAAQCLRFVQGAPRRRGPRGRIGQGGKTAVRVALRSAR